MKKTAFAIAALLAAALSSIAHAADSPMDLAKAKNCLACHAVASKLVGPSYADVAERYKDNKPARDKLVAKVIAGGSGSWGVIPMPSNMQVTPAEAKILVDWILLQKK